MGVFINSYLERRIYFYCSPNWCVCQIFINLLAIIVCCITYLIQLSLYACYVMRISCQSLSYVGVLAGRWSHLVATCPFVPSAHSSRVEPLTRDLQLFEPIAAVGVLYANHSGSTLWAKHVSLLSVTAIVSARIHIDTQFLHIIT